MNSLKISVIDDNTHKDTHGAYNYSIAVKTTADGKTYWSDPEILNRGGN